MKTQVIYSETQGHSLQGMWQSILTSAPMTNLTDWFSQMMEERITPQQTLRLIHAQIAFAALVLFGGASPAMSLVLFAWFALSVLQYWRNGKR